VNVVKNRPPIGQREDWTKNRSGDVSEKRKGRGNGNGRESERGRILQRGNVRARGLITCQSLIGKGSRRKGRSGRRQGADGSRPRKGISDNVLFARNMHKRG
jgi:hypothetical protein